MFSLWNLAQIGKQPDLQYLDVETLNEINKHIYLISRGKLI